MPKEPAVGKTFSVVPDPDAASNPATIAAKLAEPEIDLIARDRALAMLNAPSWRPEANTTLTAHLCMVRRGGETSEYGVYPILVFKRADKFPFPVDGEYVAFHAFHSVARDQIAALRPNPADMPLMTIHYVGRVRFGKTVLDEVGEPIYVEDPSKSDYENFTVINGTGADLVVNGFDWDAPENQPKSKN